MEIEKLDELDLPDEVRKEIEETIKLNEDNSSVIDTQNKRITELEEQVNITNKTLEEVQKEKIELTEANKKNMETKPNEVKPEEVKPAEVKPEEVKPVEVKSEVKPVDVIQPKPEEIKADGTVDIKALEARLIQLENDKMLDKLNEDIKRVMVEFPNSVREKILIELANGSDKTIDEIAKESHEAETKRIDDLKASITKEKEAEIEERVRKELAGSNVLPQSPASGSAVPGANNAATKKVSMNDAWAEAKKKALDDAKTA